jgi:hypothetical protein
VYLFIEIELLVTICMDSNKEGSPSLYVFDNGVYTTSAQVVASRQHEVVAGVIAQVPDVLLGVVNIAETARVVGGDGALNLGGCKAGGLCKEMLVCGCSKGRHGDRMSWGMG